MMRRSSPATRTATRRWCRAFSSPSAPERTPRNTPPHRRPPAPPTMVQCILVDISARKDLEDQLRHQALHDPLTELPNRVLFVDRLSHALIRRARSANGLARRLLHPRDPNGR